MATLMARVQKALEKEFSPKEILLEPAGRGMVDGWIISKSFDGLSDLERQQKVHGLLEKHFNMQDRRRILTIFALTPLEKKIIIDEEENGLIPAAKKNKSSSSKRTSAILTVRRRNGHLRPKRRLSQTT